MHRIEQFFLLSFFKNLILAMTLLNSDSISNDFIERWNFKATNNAVQETGNGK